MDHLFCFGFSYTAKFLINRLNKTHNNDFKFSATSRSHFEIPLVDSYIFDQLLRLPEDITHILISVPPNDGGDLVVNNFAQHILKLKNLKWIGYLSTTGVYGHTKGEWVDEKSPISPTNQVAKNRVSAETQWLDLFHKYNIPLHIFRLSAIYGPERSAFEQVNRILLGLKQLIYKEGQVFSRIHVEDIAQTLEASILKCNPGSIYNLSDDLPSSSIEVIHYACDLLKIPRIKSVRFEDANLSEMEKYFYSECKRVSNKKIKEELQIKLQYRDYKKGLLAISHLF